MPGWRPFSKSFLQLAIYFTPKTWFGHVVLIPSPLTSSSGRTNGNSSSEQLQFGEIMLEYMNIWQHPVLSQWWYLVTNTDFTMFLSYCTSILLKMQTGISNTKTQVYIRSKQTVLGSPWLLTYELQILWKNGKLLSLEEICFNNCHSLPCHSLKHKKMGGFLDPMRTWLKFIIARPHSSHGTAHLTSYQVQHPLGIDLLLYFSLPETKLTKDYILVALTQWCIHPSMSAVFLLAKRWKSMTLYWLRAKHTWQWHIVNYSL